MLSSKITLKVRPPRVQLEESDGLRALQHRPLGCTTAVSWSSRVIQNLLEDVSGWKSDLECQCDELPGVGGGV